MATPLEQASNPATPAQKLQELATGGGEAQLAVAHNPSAYPELLQWIAQWGEPAAKVAAEERLADETVLASERNSGAGSQPASRPSSRPSSQPSRQPSGEEGSVPASGEATVLASAASSTAPPPSAPEQPSSPVPPVSAGPPLGSSPGAPGSAPPPDGGAPPPFPPATSAPQPKRNMVPILIGVAVVAALAIAGALWFFLGNKEGDNSPASEGVVVIEDSAAKEEGGPAQSEGETAEDPDGGSVTEDGDQSVEGDALEQEQEGEREPDPTVIHYPVPAASLGVRLGPAPLFQSNKGDIACELGEELRCTLYAYQFTINGPACGSIEATITLTDTDVSWDCASGAVPKSGAGELAYSATSASGDYACTSTVRGLSCWNIYTGRAFAISRDGFVEGYEGVIPESQFTWGQ